MVKKAIIALTVVAALALFGAYDAALAVDPPKWVAAIFVEAQRAVGLRWNPVPGATGYKVLRSETKGSGYQEVSSGTAPQFFDQKVEAGTAYFYVLQTVAGAEVSANGDERAITIPGQKKVAATAPEWVQVDLRQTTEFGKTSFRVSMTWVKKPDAVAYNIYRTENSGKDYQLLSSGSETSYIDATVQTGKTYFYTLTALDNSFQESPMSVEKSVAVQEAAKEAKKPERLVDNKLAIKTSKVLVSIKDNENLRSYKGASDIVVDSAGRIHFADTVNAVIHEFTPGGEYIKTYGEKGHEIGRIAYPLGLGIDKDDNVYVADRAATPRIVVFDDAGKFVREILVPPPDAAYVEKLDPRERNKGPLIKDVAVAADGRIYATDNNLHRIVQFDANGKFEKQFGGPGTQPGQLNVPGWCAINKQNELHVCNGFNRRIEVFDLDGNYVRTYGMAKSYIGSFLGTTGITFDAAGNSVVVDAAMSTIQFFGPAGAYLFHMGDTEAKIETESKQRPQIAINAPAGIVYNPVSNAFYMALSGAEIQARQLTQE
ncbi:MAG TPA: 6-bladed beta-propeller [Candidatus Methanoperedens sp.]|nr:6-bladed beta-propeller [Candidatus Methanoperedens sp.]